MGATLYRGARASHCSGFSCCGAQGLGRWASVVVRAQWLCHTGLVAPRHVESSWTRDWTHFPCIDRQIFIYSATREAFKPFQMRFSTEVTAAAKSLQLCPTLCDPIDGSPPGSSVPGILQARTLEWVAISFSNAWKRKVKVKSLSRVRLLATPWTAAHQATPSMGFPRQECWSGVPLF